MKALWILVFIPISFLQAQVIKTDFIAYYNFQFITDTTELTYSKVEPYLLYKRKDKSFFINANAKFGDSLVYELEEKRKSNPSKNNILNLSGWPQYTRCVSDMRVYKNHKKNIRQIILPKSYCRQYIQEPLALFWTITAQQEKIGDFNCILATTTHGGRSYKVWFTMDIPISDGPYVFNGLPGLIIRVRDDRDFYRFDLTRLDTKSKKEIFHQSFLAKKWTKEISRLDFCKASRKQKEDPQPIIGTPNVTPELRLRLKKQFAKRFDLLIEKN